MDGGRARPATPLPLQLRRSTSFREGKPPLTLPPLPPPGEDAGADADAEELRDPAPPPAPRGRGGE